MFALVRTILILTLGLAAAGCNATGRQAMSGKPDSGATLAFESIDGPPPAVFQRLVRKLNEEAESRNVPVVSSAKQAPYRVRGYVALGVYKKKKHSVVSWVFDVYDMQHRRTVRFSGEEMAGVPGRDPWASVDDEVLKRVARAGMERLAAYFHPASAAAASQSVVLPETETRNIARSVVDDFHPEAQGIFRLFRAAPEVAQTGADTEPTGSVDKSVPLPRHRPAASAPDRDGRVALATPVR